MNASEFLKQAKAQLATHGLKYEGPIVGVLTNMAMAVEAEHAEKSETTVGLLRSYSKNATENAERQPQERSRRSFEAKAIAYECSANLAEATLLGTGPWARVAARRGKR